MEGFSREKITKFLSNYKYILLLTFSIFLITAIIEFQFGRSFLGPDGKFGIWANAWGSENSQRLIDPYSTSHILHGIIFFWLLVWFFPKMPLEYKFLVAVALEAGWEILENSPLIIERYRSTTIAVGYIGDSVLNSLSDIVMAIIGFYIAYKYKIWVSIFLFLIFEIGMLILVRDNLTLNVIMLIYPIEAIRTWQAVMHLAS